MHYLTVLNVDSKYYLLLTEDGNGKASINAQNTLEDAIAPFQGFKDKILGDYESYASTTLGLLAINPSFIGFDKPAADLAQFIIGNPTRLTGGTIIGLHKSLFNEIDKSILQYEVKTLFKVVVEHLEQ